MTQSDRGPMDQFAAHLDRGWDLVSRGDLAGAQVSAEKSLELDQQSPEAHNLMGYVLAAEGKAEEAVEHYRQAIDLDEGFVEAMLNAAEVLIHPLGDHEQALAMVEEALDLAEGDDEIADAMLLKFDALMHKGDRAGAERVVAALPDGPFESANLDFLVGRAHFEIGNSTTAEPCLRRALERDPVHAEAKYYLGLVLEQNGDARAATLAFLEARQLDAQMGAPPGALPPEHFEKRVRSALERLVPAWIATLEGALVVAADLPGVEVVADGVDPRIEALLDAVSAEGDAPRVGRVFVYQRNVERVAIGLAEVEDEILRALERELSAAFPELARQIGQLGETSRPALPLAEEVTSEDEDETPGSLLS